MAVVRQSFSPPQTLFLGVQDRQNIISWRWSLPAPIQTQFGEDRCTQFRVIVVTDTARPPARPPAANTARPPFARPSATDRTDYNTLRRYV